MPVEQSTKDAKTLGGWSVFLFCGLVLVDQLSKKFATNIFKNFVFAFSLPLPIWLIYSIYAAVLLEMSLYVYKNYKNFSVSTLLAWVLIFSGAFCNVFERIFLGYVRDFIYITFYIWTGIYNFADAYILLGVILLLAQNKNPKYK